MFKLSAHSSLLLRGLEDHRMPSVVVLLEPVSIMSNGQCVEVMPKHVFGGTGYSSVKTTEFILNCRFSFLVSSAMLVEMTGNLQDRFLWWNHGCESQNSNDDTNLVAVQLTECVKTLDFSLVHVTVTC